MKKKSMLIVGSLAIILFLVVVVMAARIVFYHNGNGVYGNRLDGIENYPISDEKITEMKDTISKNKECTNVTYKLQGKIMKFFIEVQNDTSLTTAQRMGDNIVDSFSETELGYYDITIYVTSPDEKEPYPMIGYKNKNKTAISWTVNKGEVDEEK